MPLRRFRFRAMGSPCELHLHVDSPDDARRVALRAVQEVWRLERKYSRYRDDSLASRINRSAGDPAGVEVDPETAALLGYADTCFRQSGGLFDISSGVLRRAWKRGLTRLPSRSELALLLERVGWERVRWSAPRLVLPVPGMELDFGGYVKEYAVDRVTELCRDLGLRHGLVDLGGDLGALGPHPDGSPWRVGVRHPRRPECALATLDLAGGAIASSGDYERFTWIDGVRYSHLLDPRSGWPVRGLAAASVVAPHCLVAGAASTIAMLMDEPAAGAWLDGLGLPNLRVTQNGEVGGTLAPGSWKLDGSGSAPRTGTSSGPKPSSTRPAAAEAASGRLSNPVR